MTNITCDMCGDKIAGASVQFHQQDVHMQAAGQQVTVSVRLELPNGVDLCQQCVARVSAGAADQIMPTRTHNKYDVDVAMKRKDARDAKARQGRINTLG